MHSLIVAIHHPFLLFKFVLHFYHFFRLLFIPNFFQLYHSVIDASFALIELFRKAYHLQVNYSQ